MKYYRVGVIFNTHGLKGDLKIKEYSDFDRFQKGKRLYINYRDEYKEVIVKQKSEYGQNILVRFEGLEDINLVEKYKGSTVYISEEDQGELEDGEYYYHELIGLEVVNDRADHRGYCVDVREVPQGHLLVVKKDDGKNALVPFRDEFIQKVTKERIIVKEIEGLF